MSSKGQVVLSPGIRRKCRLSAGDELELVDAGDHLAVWPAPADPVTRLRGLLAASPSQRSLVESLLESRRTDVDSE